MREQGVGILNVHEKRALVEKWYRQYAKYLFHAACLLGPVSQAEETVQETFRIVLEKDGLDEISYPKPWLRKILYNGVRNRLRLQSGSESSLTCEIEALHEREASYTDQLDVELEYGGAIPADDLHLLRLAYVERLPYAEIAYKLGISERACQKRVERAKNKLKKFFENEKI